MLSPGEIVKMSACVLVKNCFFVCYSHVALTNASPFGFQSYMIWEPISWAGAFKVGAPVVWSKTFSFSGRSWKLGVPS